MRPTLRFITTGRGRPAANKKTDDDELFEMANLSPRMTGLPMSVWVSPRGRARHDVRIKVNMAHGNQMTIDNTAVVAVRPNPHMIEGELSSDDWRAVSEWVSLNSAAIIDYWNYDIDTGQFIERLTVLPGS